MRLSHTIPATAWRARHTWSPRAASLVPLFIGLTLFGFGEGLLVRSTLGATPWTVFAEGVAGHLGWPLGWATFLISAVVLLAWLPLGVPPGLGTIANIIVIAYVLDVTASSFYEPHGWWLQLSFVVAGVASIGAGSALYLTTGLGPGPRDGLMTGLHRRLGVSVVYVRYSIEATVFLVGWALGGRPGVGTAIYVAAIGASLGLNLRAVERVSGWWRS